MTLGQIEITPSERSFSVAEPELSSDAVIDGWARLIGADVGPGTATTGGPLAITLHWQALEEAGGVDAIVFVQLLSPDDRVIAQHDGVPAQGRWPTSRWISSQTIVDRHELVFNDPEYRGPVRVIAGLYQASTLQRLATNNGADHVELASITLQ